MVNYEKIQAKHLSLSVECNLNNSIGQQGFYIVKFLKHLYKVESNYLLQREHPYPFF